MTKAQNSFLAEIIDRKLEPTFGLLFDQKIMAELVKRYWNYSLKFSSLTIAIKRFRACLQMCCVNTSRQSELL